MGIIKNGRLQVAIAMCSVLFVVFVCAQPLITAWLKNIKFLCALVKSDSFVSSAAPALLVIKFNVRIALCAPCTYIEEYFECKMNLLFANNTGCAILQGRINSRVKNDDLQWFYSIFYLLKLFHIYFTSFKCNIICCTFENICF